MRPVVGSYPRMVPEGRWPRCTACYSHPCNATLLLPVLLCPVVLYPVVLWPPTGSSTIKYTSGDSQSGRVQSAKTDKESFHFELRMILILDPYPWSYPWSLSLILILDPNHWSLSLVLILDPYPWSLSSILNPYPLSLSLILIPGPNPWSFTPIHYLCRLSGKA